MIGYGWNRGAEGDWGLILDAKIHISILGVTLSKQELFKKSSLLPFEFRKNLSL